MGRTFGLIIVSVGLWLVFSLPTSDPVDGGSAQTAAYSPTRQVASVAATTPSSTIITTAGHLPGLDPVVTGPAPAGMGLRTSRTLDERTQAARSREIESEPAATTRRPPVPVAVGVTPSNPGMGSPSNAAPGAAAASTPVAVAGGIAVKPTSVAEQPIPAPVPIARGAIPGLSQAGARYQMVPLTPTKPAASTQPDAVDRRWATVASAATPQSDRGPAINGGAGTVSPIKAPRIVEIVRRDLAAATGRKPDGASDASAGAKQPPPATPSRSTSTSPALAKVGRSPVGASTAAVTVKITPDELTRDDPKLRKSAGGTSNAGLRQDSDTGTSPAKPAPAKPLRRDPVVVHTELLPLKPAAPALPQHLRVAQVYAPPAYLGRVVVRYAPPPAYFVPSSGSGRRSQFRGDTMWDSIRRGGL